MASVSNLAVGQAISGSGIAPGTVITAVNGTSLSVSIPVATAIPAATKLSFGSGTAGSSAAETYRQSYNTYLRHQAAALGCAGVVDDDVVFADQGGSGKWRTDLGSASADGVHPSAALHQAAVAAGLLKPSMFPAP